MKMIAGFFASHHDVDSLGNIPSAISEVKKTFECDCANKIVILESMKFDVKKAKTIFEKSLHSDDLLELYLKEDEEIIRVVRKIHRDEKIPIQHVWKKIRDAYLNNNAQISGSQYRTNQLDKLSEIRKSIKFQLLFESGSTREIDKLNMDMHKIIKSNRDLILSGAKDDAESSAISYRGMLTKISMSRENLLRNSIDKLLAGYSSVCVQILMGTRHYLFLDPYLSKNDVSVRVVVDPNDEHSCSSMLYDKIEKGADLTNTDIALAVIDNCIGMLVEAYNGITGKVGISPDIILEIVSHNFSAEHYNRLMQKSHNFPQRMSVFLKNTGVLDELTQVNKDFVDFCSAITSLAP